jgi:hypothetical protein
MGTALVVPCVGSADPHVREYVHDFGLCALNFTFIEDGLRHHLLHIAMLRADWHGEGGQRSIKGKKMRKEAKVLEELTLGGLVTRYSKSGDPALVAVLQPIVEMRNTLLHNRIVLSEGASITSANLNKVRETLQALWKQVRDASNDLRRVDADVFAQLIERAKREGMVTKELGPPLEEEFAAYRHFLNHLEENNRIA